MDHVIELMKSVQQDEADLNEAKNGCYNPAFKLDVSLIEARKRDSLGKIKSDASDYAN